MRCWPGEVVEGVGEDEGDAAELLAVSNRRKAARGVLSTVAVARRTWRRRIAAHRRGRAAGSRSASTGGGRGSLWAGRFGPREAGGGSSTAS